MATAVRVAVATGATATAVVAVLKGAGCGAVVLWLPPPKRVDKEPRILVRSDDSVRAGDDTALTWNGEVAVVIVLGLVDAFDPDATIETALVTVVDLVVDAALVVDDTIEFKFKEIEDIVGFSCDCDHRPQTFSNMKCLEKDILFG